MAHGFDVRKFESERLVREFLAFSAETMTNERFTLLEGLLRSFHDFFRKALGVLYVLEPPHTNNHLLKFLRPNERLAKSELSKWRLDPDHGLLHGLITAYFAVRLKSGWQIPDLRDDVEQQRLIASCLVHDYSKVASAVEPHDQELRRYFGLLLPETYTHSDPPAVVPLVQADRIELLRYEDRSWLDLERVLENLPNDTACFEVWAFYAFVRPALARLFQGRNEVWLRHGAEAADWRERYAHAPMVSRPRDFWPSFYYPWPDFPDYWAVEVGALTANNNKPHLVDYYFPAGLLTVDEYRAAEPNAAIVSAPGREHELAYGKVPLREWLFVLRDEQLTHDRYLVTGAGGFLTLPILTHVLDVADLLYSRLYALG